jgi:hypothetical protein
MKKIIFIAALIVLGTNCANALIRLYCGANGNLFVINWFYNINNELCYEVSYAGHCEGGPWSAGVVVLSPQEAGSTTEATAAIYSTLSSYTSGENHLNGYEEDISNAGDVISYTDGTVWVDPGEIDIQWAGELAGSDGKSVYALSLVSHPFTSTLQFNIWSTQSETIAVKLRDTNNSNIVLNTTVNVAEGENQVTGISLSGISPGNYVLIIGSAANTVSRSVTVN